MQWRPIEDLPADWRQLASDDLPPLAAVWSDEAGRLRGSGEFKAFMERLRREMAIETGVIERLYTIDRGITRLLIEQGIDEALIPRDATDRPVKQVVALIKDQEAAVEGLLDFVGRQRDLSTSYIKQLHQVLTRSQDSTDAVSPTTGRIIRVPLIRGDWKRQPNNPVRHNGSVHEYCPPEHVASEMDKLIELHKRHRDLQVPPDVEAAWLHHRFTQIHPFQDGNGRVARCLATLVFIQSEWFPLVITRDDRADYVAALEKADLGDLSDLIGLFAKSQRRAFVRCLSLSEEILSKTERTRAVIASVVQRLKQNQTASMDARRRKVEGFALELFNLASKRLNQVAEEITLSVQNLPRPAKVFLVEAPPGDKRSYYHRYQIIQTAKQLEYFANTSAYHSWIQLVIEVATPTILLISFHVLGHEYRGVLVCSACGYHKSETEDDEHNISDIQALSEAPFQFSYADEQGNLVERFQNWLEEMILAGLQYWNESI